MCSVVDFWQGSDYVSGSEYPRVLNILMPLVLNVPKFLDIPGFWIYQRSEYARVTRGSEYAWIPEYAWIGLIMFVYVWICLNKPQLPEWLLFYISPFLYLFYNPFFTWTHGYLFERLQESKQTGGYSLKEQETCFLKETKFNFSIAAESVLFVFCFRLNTFTSKI